MKSHQNIVPEDYKVRRRRFPQVFFESCADGHGSASVVSFFYPSFFSFFVFFAMKVLFFLPSIKKAKAKMKIKAKKINCASENAIQSSVFVFQWKPIVTNASGRQIFYTSCAFAFWVMLCYPLHHNYFKYEYYLCGRIMQQMNTQWSSESYF